MGLIGVVVGILGGLLLIILVNVNLVGVILIWCINFSIYFIGYGVYFMVDQVNGGLVFIDFVSWMVGFYFLDVFVEGNMVGLMFG